MKIHSEKAFQKILAVPKTEQKKDGQKVSF
jgi:hypothetical protein